VISRSNYKTRQINVSFIKTAPKFVLINVMIRKTQPSESYVCEA